MIRQCLQKYKKGIFRLSAILHSVEWPTWRYPQKLLNGLKYYKSIFKFMMIDVPKKSLSKNTLYNIVRFSIPPRVNPVFFETEKSNILSIWDLRPFMLTAKLYPHSLPGNKHWYIIVWRALLRFPGKFHHDRYTLQVYDWCITVIL